MGLGAMKRLLGTIAVTASLALLSACSGGGEETNSSGNGSAAATENSRSAKFKEIAKNNKIIGDELKKDAPSVTAIASNVEALDALAKDLPNWFPGTEGPEADIKTEAKAEIWQQPAEFKAAADKFASATGALQAAVASGDVTEVQKAAGEVGPTCKGCHDQFRAKK